MLAPSRREYTRLDADFLFFDTVSVHQLESGFLAVIVKENTTEIRFRL